MYSCYDSRNGDWSNAKMLYNGATGSVKALQAAMLPDGTAMAVYSLDRSGTGDISAYEIAYCTVAADGTPGTAMLATWTAILTKTPRSLQPTSAAGMTDLSSVGTVSETAAAISSCWLWTAAAPCPTVSPALCLP